ncbi:MAG TPA: metalloregulator ArsR/SmtB family transcription factor [Phycisphaerae bacterium]|nr:metalloregulator ArsR/SmtB family transcription factor [Phycisphaerae bacterium]
MAKKISVAAKAELSEWARGFALLSDPTRLGVLKLLAGGPKNVTALCNALGLKQPTVSHHLGLLRMGRLVLGTRMGKSVVYTTDKKNLKELASAIAKLMPAK